MYPELFRIGTFPITTYGIFLAGGMSLALYVASRLAGRDGLIRITNSSSNSLGMKYGSKEILAYDPGSCSTVAQA